MQPSLTLLCAAKLHSNQLERHLELFEHIPEVKRVIVVRRQPLSARLSKVHNVTFEAGSVLSELFRMNSTVRRVSAEYPVDWVLGFNPVPWGSAALVAGKMANISSCLSLIGMDFIQIQKWWGRGFLTAVRHAEAITVTGRSMQQKLIELGVASNKIYILPHSVDVQRFTPNHEQIRWDVLAVGQLIKRKRMDVIIDAVALLKKRGRSLRVGILGRGPMETELRARCERLNISDLVDFLGYRDDVEHVLHQSKIFSLMSEWEGVPFALMEAMAAGLIPIMTRVGTISDWVRDGDNGLLVDVGSPLQLADAIERVLSSEGKAMLARLIAERDQLSFKKGVGVWRQILGLPA